MNEIVESRLFSSKGRDGAHACSDGNDALCFREARAEDLDTVAALLKTLGYAVSRERLQPVYLRFLRDPTHQCILAVSHPEGQVIGMITLRRLPCLRLAGEILVIEELVVRPEWRGRGVGRDLAARAASYAVTCHAVRIEVLTSENRPALPKAAFDGPAPRKSWRGPQVIDQGADDAINAVSIRHFFRKTADVRTTTVTAEETIIQTRHRIP